MNRYAEQAEEWFKRGAHDIETAQLIYDKGGYTDIIVLHIHQAVEKYLKGLLVFNGIKPKRTHDLTSLLDAVIKIDPAFEKFFDFCDMATKYYVVDRYPPGPPVEYSYDEVKQSLKIASAIIEKIKKRIQLK